MGMDGWRKDGVRWALPAGLALSALFLLLQTFKCTAVRISARAALTRARSGVARALARGRTGRLVALACRDPPARQPLRVGVQALRVVAVGGGLGEECRRRARVSAWQQPMHSSCSASCGMQHERFLVGHGQPCARHMRARAAAPASRDYAHSYRLPQIHTYQDNVCEVMTGAQRSVFERYINVSEAPLPLSNSGSASSHGTEDIYSYMEVWMRRARWPPRGGVST
jgi:hypothetical protein